MVILDISWLNDDQMIISWLFHCIFGWFPPYLHRSSTHKGGPFLGPGFLRTPTPWRPSLIHAASIFTRSYRVRKLEREITEKMTMMWLFLIILDEFWMLGMDIGWILGGHGMCGGFRKDLKGSKRKLMCGSWPWPVLTLGHTGDHLGQRFLFFLLKKSTCKHHSR